MNTLGHHILAEFFSCDSKILSDSNLMEIYMKKAAIESGATILNSAFHTFNPNGVSGIVIIAESYLALHTWPEYGYAALDIFTCGDTVNPRTALDVLEKDLKAASVKSLELNRGAVQDHHVLQQEPFPEPAL